MIDHPSHYIRGGVEACDVIDAWDLDFNLGCVVKYACRAGYKCDEIEDLEKMVWYSKRALENAHKRRATGGGCVERKDR